MKRTVQVKSSDGVTYYAVEVEDGKATSCPCAGYTHRQKCRHLGEAEDLDRTQYRREKKSGD